MRTAMLFLLLVALAAAAAGQSPIGSSVEAPLHFRFELKREVGLQPGAVVGRCSATFEPTARELTLRCRHSVGPATALLLRRVEGATRSTLADLGSPKDPIEGSITLTEEESAELIAGRLAISIEGVAPSTQLAFGELGEPLFAATFETVGLCEWSAFELNCDDQNVCTDDSVDAICDPSAFGCSFVPNNAGCALPNATAACVSGDCTVVTCDTGFSNCDADGANGCEVTHTGVIASCGAGTNVGTYDGDRHCGFVCAINTEWDQFALQTGSTSRWLRARVFEDSDCSTNVEHRIRLVPPAGVDFDLFVYKASCAATPLSSENGPGVAEEVVVSQGENSGSDDSFDYFVLVQYVSGSSCGLWTLTFDGHNC